MSWGRGLEGSQGGERAKRYNRSGVGEGSRGSIQYLIFTMSKYSIGVYLCMGVYVHA